MKKEIISHSKVSIYIEAIKMLTPSEVKIIEQLKLGLTDLEIAESLNLSPHTVHTHKKNICRKLKLKGRNGLLKWVISYTPNV